MDADWSLAEYADSDQSAVIELCRRSLDLPEDTSEAAEIVRRLRHPGRPAAAGGRRRTVGFLAVDAGDPRHRHQRRSRPVGVVFGSIGHREPTVGHVDLVAVHPARRRRGIGRSLLVRAEATLADLGATVLRLAGNPPYHAWPGIDVRHTPAICLALALGYQPDRTAWNMTVELTGSAASAGWDTTAEERRLAERGVSVRRAGPADVPALVDFVLPTFGGTWACEVADSIGPPLAGCHLAERSGTLLGFAAYGSSRPTWFGPMGTAPAARGLGVGTVLLRRCLRDQWAAGHRRAQIGWVGPVAFYADAAGARVGRVFQLYRRNG